MDKRIKCDYCGGDLEYNFCSDVWECTDCNNAQLFQESDDFDYDYANTLRNDL